MSDTPIILLEEGWRDHIKSKALEPLEAILEEGIKRKGRLFSNNDYINAYTICYNMCTQKQPHNWSEQLYDRSNEAMCQYLTNKVLTSLKIASGEELLRQFVRRGSNHNVMIKWYSNFFQYLNRYHVKYQQLPNMNESGLRNYKKIVFDNVKGGVTQALLTMIQEEREGQGVEEDLIKKCIQIYQQMGMGDLQVYEQEFEKMFLESSRVFYGQSADAWTSEESTPSFLKRVEKLLEDESSRVAKYLLPSTDAKLASTLEKELLEKRITMLLDREGSGCRVMLANDMLDDLARLFRLFNRVSNGLEPIAEIFKAHLLDVGKEKIEQRLARLESGNSAGTESAEAKSGGIETKEGNDDPQFVKDLIFIHEKYSKMVNEQFQSNALFQKALKDAFVELVNTDSGRYKTADLISTFCDRMLKSGSTERLSDAEIEDFLEKAVQLFAYLSDKDLFGEIYRNQLSRRLLNQRSASDDMERVMVGKLKLSCGAQFTAKMEGMLNDLTICAEMSAAFESFCRENPEKTGLGKTEFSVQVLTAGHWPQFKALNEITLPAMMHRCTQVFKEYYEAKTNQRRLQWTHSLGSAIVKGTFQQKRVFDMQVTTLQAVVMIAFNADSLGGAAGGPVSYSALQENLNISDDVLKKALHSLIAGKFKILKKVAGGDAAGSKDDKKILSSDSFQFNDAFTCPMRKFRIPMASLEDSHNMKRVEEDRSHAIEASAVRIMKARKTLSHQQLVSEVLQQLSFFRPDAKLVKKRIEALIEREFLERDPDNPNIYRYLA